MKFNQHNLVIDIDFSYNNIPISNDIYFNIGLIEYNLIT